MLHQRCITSVGLRWPQASDRLGLHRYRDEDNFWDTVWELPHCSFCESHLYSSFHWEQLICCLGRSLWGRHRVLLKPQQKLEDSWCLFVCMFVHRCLILEVYNPLLCTKNLLFAQQWFACPPLTFNPHWEAIRRGRLTLPAHRLKKKKRKSRQYQNRW